jgi:hypothetical protein
MSLKYAYTTPDGGVAIVHAAPKEQLERVLGPMTDAQYEAHVRQRSIPDDATDVQKLPDGWTPPDDRTFRDAWKNDKGKVSVDLNRAKAIAEKIGIAAQDIASAKDVLDLRRLVSRRA